MPNFKKNEEKALQLYSIIESSNNREKIINHINDVGLPAWDRNLAILDELDSIEGLYDEFKEQNEILREYLTLRIEVYKLIKLTFFENTDIYTRKINELNTRIEILLNKLATL